jgi:putative endopeptidase
LTVKRLLPGAIAIVVSLLAACTTKPQPKAKPEFGAWGFDTSGQDKSKRPEDGFVRYANGGWLDRTSIPQDKSGVPEGKVTLRPPFSKFAPGESV